MSFAVSLALINSLSGLIGQMSRILVFMLFVLFSSSSYAWGFATGKVDALYVNTYGNYLEGGLNGGYCFKLAGFDYHFKVAYSDSGEKRNNMLLVQAMVLSASMSGRELRATYVDWGTDPTCRMNGALLPAKWLENVQVLN